MKKFLGGISVFFATILLVLCQSFPAHAALSALGTTWTGDDTYEVNNATPGTSKAFLGTYAQGPLGTVAATTFASNVNGNPTGKCLTGAGTFTTPTTTVFLKTTGANFNESYCLGNAVIPGSTTPAYNQRLTIVLVTDGGKDFRITPLTKTGFTDVQLDDAKDSVTLRYIDATVGWTVEGNAGAVIN